MTILENCNKEGGVYLLSDYLADSGFETNYIHLRRKENRLYDEEIIASLPYAKNVIHKEEWKMRAKSAERVTNYFKDKGGYLLDLGCGNGWFSAMIANNRDMNVFGADINLYELKQAAQLFSTENLSFLYSDMLNASVPKKIFNYITLNASVQYFKDLKELVNRLFEILSDDGEVHIMDSPFYGQNEIENARQRTISYFKQIGFENMAEYYFHHSWNDLEPFKYKISYSPKKTSILAKLTGNRDIPFPWIRITK